MKTMFNPTFEVKDNMSFEQMIEMYRDLHGVSIAYHAGRIKSLEVGIADKLAARSDWCVDIDRDSLAGHKSRLAEETAAMELGVSRYTDQIVRRDARAAVEKELAESEGLNADDLGIRNGDVYKFTVSLETDDGDLRAHLIVPVSVRDGVVSFDKSVPSLSTKKKLTGMYGDVEFLISEHYDESENSWKFDD